jgi:hypothetical protein
MEKVSLLINFLKEKLKEAEKNVSQPSDRN